MMAPVSMPHRHRSNMVHTVCICEAPTPARLSRTQRRCSDWIAAREVPDDVTGRVTGEHQPAHAGGTRRSWRKLMNTASPSSSNTMDL
jgi:hypothetical protein